ncbi:MAG: TolC family protein, partial [Prevotella sp.]|nr:TolC family protein [Prevotella sp.]
QSLKVAKGSRIPGLKIGYTGEFTREEKYQGPTIGLSLPLWGSGRKVKVAKLHVEAAEKSLEDTRLNLTTQLRGIYREALHLQDTYLRYKKHLTECDNSELLKKSLDSGQITLLEYLQERQFVHEMHEKILIAERDLALRKAELIF